MATGSSRWVQVAAESRLKMPRVRVWTDGFETLKIVAFPTRTA